MEAPSVAQETVEQLALTFPVLTDPEHTVIDAFQVYSAGDNRAIPALFLIDSASTIQYGRVGRTHGPFEEKALDGALQWVREHPLPPPDES